MLKLAELNAMDSEQFTGALGGIFEHSPWVPDETVEKRPFHSNDQLHAALCQTVMEAGEDKWLALIRSHPDLVGNATLTPESSRE
ncbi:MAG TPA: 2-oxo-4-hydroxy-4-carboxy-5-ureidoimidazoline decarboxylase, partial [Chthoniobacterales bacterium]